MIQAEERRSHKFYHSKYLISLDIGETKVKQTEWSSAAVSRLHKKVRLVSSVRLLPAAVDPIKNPLLSHLNVVLLTVNMESGRFK